MSYTLYFNPLVQGYTTSSPDSFYSNYSDVSDPSLSFSLDNKQIISLALDLSDTYVFTPSGLETNDGSVIIAKVIGSARIKTTGVDSDLSTPITGYLPAYGTAIFPGYVLISTFNVTALEILGQADGTTVELFYGSKEDIVASNIGLITTIKRPPESQLTLTTATTVNICTTPAAFVTLQPGTYEVSGAAHFEMGSNVATKVALGISTISATLPSVLTIAVPNTSGEIYMLTQAGTAFINTELPVVIPTFYLVVPANTTSTLYLVAAVTFASSTATVCGYLTTRKVL